MGADGFISEPSSNVRFRMSCHECQQPVWMDEPPIGDHAECVGSDGRIPVNIALENYEER